MLFLPVSPTHSRLQFHNGRALPPRLHPHASSERRVSRWTATIGGLLGDTLQETWMTGQDCSLVLNCSYPSCLSQSDGFILTATIPSWKPPRRYFPSGTNTSGNTCRKGQICVPPTFRSAHSWPPRNYSRRLDVEGRLIAL